MKLEIRKPDGTSIGLEVDENHVNVESIISRICGPSTPTESDVPEMTVEEVQSISQILDYARNLPTTPALGTYPAYKFNDLQVVHLYRDYDLCAAEISRNSHLAPNEVRDILKTYNIPMRNKIETGKRIARLTREEIVSRIDAVLTETTITFTKYDMTDDEVVELYKIGYSCADIQRICTISDKHISTLLNSKGYHLLNKRSNKGPISDKILQGILTARNN